MCSKDFPFGKLHGFYVCEDGKSYGIPVRAFKKSMIKASTNFFSRMEGGMRNVREGLTIVGDIAPLIYKSLTVNTSYVKPKNSPLANRRLRNQFNEWSCVLTIKFNENQISIEQIIAILNWAGFSNGVGGWRKECGGNYGSYKAIPLNMQE